MKTPDDIPDGTECFLVGDDSERLRNLLAVLHRDGGHHVAAVGVGQACVDATKIFYNGLDAVLSAERTRDELNNARNVLADELTRVTRECDALRARAELAEAERADALSELTRVTAAHARDDAADAYDRLVARVWEAATGDTHEGPASVEVLLDAVRELRAIVEGRTTPPTWQEIERHHESGGSWMCSAGGVADVSERASVTHRWADDHRDLPGMGGCRWWPLDTHGRLCAWPVVTR